MKHPNIVPWLAGLTGWIADQRVQSSPGKSARPAERGKADTATSEASMLSGPRRASLVMLALTLAVALASLSCESGGGMGVGVGAPTRWGGGTGAPPVFVGGPSY